MCVLNRFIRQFGALTHHREFQPMAQRHRALRRGDRHVNFGGWRAIPALPQPLANSTARLYRIEQISGGRLKDADRLDEF
jgi:hypothetical protein